MRYCIILLSLVLAACETISSWNPFVSSSAPPAPVSSDSAAPAKVEGSTDLAPEKENANELKLAQLWARVDQLERAMQEQREYNRILEKGLTLGIIPEELKQRPSSGYLIDASGQTQVGHAATRELPPGASQGDAAPLSNKKWQDPDQAEKNRDAAVYRQKIQDAQMKFSSGQYGQAIAAYNEIGETFSSSLTEGSEHYWIGLSWYYLKEFQLADQSFMKLLEQFPENKWIPYARFYRAKIDQVNGFARRSLDKMKQLLEEYPSQDLSEMIKSEIEKLKENL